MVGGIRRAEQGRRPRPESHGGGTEELSMFCWMYVRFVSLLLRIFRVSCV